MPLFALTAFGFVKKHAAWFLFGALALALLGSVLAVYSRGHDAGVTAERVKTIELHTQTIKEVRDDEHLAQTTADAVGAAVAARQAADKIDTDKNLKDIHDALAAIPAPVAGAPVACVVPDGVRASSNAIVDRANGAADYAGAARGADAN